MKLLSDPWGRGWDLFGTHDFQPNFTFLTPHTIWYVQVAALVIGPRRRTRGRARPGGRPLPHAADGALDAVPDARADGALHGRRPLGAEPGMSAGPRARRHPGPDRGDGPRLRRPGLIFGYFIRRSAKKEREREKERQDAGTGLEACPCCSFWPRRGAFQKTFDVLGRERLGLEHLELRDLADGLRNVASISGTSKIARNSQGPSHCEEALDRPALVLDDLVGSCRSTRAVLTRFSRAKRRELEQPDIA